jgi:hypothetical protein
MSNTHQQFVDFVNQMAEKNDVKNFLRLIKHPKKRDLGESSVKKLFAAAPFESFEAMAAISGISQDILVASIEALDMNNNTSLAFGDFTVASDQVVDEPLLWVDQFYSTELSAVKPVAGAALVVVVDCINIFQGDTLPDGNPTASFRYISPKVNAEEIPFLMKRADASVYETLTIESPLRHVFTMTLPRSLAVGSGILTLQWGEALASNAIDFEITSEALAHVRNKCSGKVWSKAEPLIEGATGLVAWHNPLPHGAAVFDGSSGELVFDFPEGEWLPFFAFERTSLFEQNKTLWAFVEINTQEIVDYESTIWPSIKIPTGITDEASGEVFYDDVGPEFGRLHNRENGFLGLDIVLQERSVSPAPEMLPRKKWVPNGIGFLAKKEGCPEIRKVALLIQLYDEAKDEAVTGRPNFDKVQEKTKDIMWDLGCQLIFEITPKYFTKTKPFRVPTSTQFNSFKPIKDAIEYIVSLEGDCCFELIIVINSHQSRSGYLKFRHKKIHGGGKNPSANFLSKLIGETIANATQNIAPECKPAAELIIHSCYSGKVRGPKVGLTGITGSSTSAHTSNGMPGNYCFLEALAECIEKNPGITYPEIFDCVVKGTERRAKGIGKKQTPQRKLPEDK